MALFEHVRAALVAAVVALPVPSSHAAASSASPPHRARTHAVRPKPSPARKPSRTPSLPHPPPSQPVTVAPSPGASAVAPTGGTLRVTETLFDAGSVDRGSNIDHVFELSNGGTADLTIDARPGCGCTVVDFDKVIAPGRTGKVSASVHTGDFKGAIIKSITVSTNDPQHHSTILQIKANVMVPIDVQPADTVTMDGRAGAIEAKALKIASTDGSVFDVIAAESTDPAFSVSIEPSAALPQPGRKGTLRWPRVMPQVYQPASVRKISALRVDVADGETTPAPSTPGKRTPRATPAKAGTLASGSASYEVTVKVSKDVALGHPSATITLKTSHPKEPELPIRIFANVTGDVLVQPERIILQLGASEPASSRTDHVAIREQADGRSLAVTNVESRSPLIKATLTTVTPGQQFDLQIAYDGPPTQEPIDSEVTLTTDDPRQGTIVVPVFGRGDAIPGGAPPEQGAAAATPPGGSPVATTEAKPLPDPQPGREPPRRGRHHRPR